MGMIMMVKYKYYNLTCDGQILNSRFFACALNNLLGENLLLLVLPSSLPSPPREYLHIYKINVHLTAYT